MKKIITAVLFFSLIGMTALAQEKENGKDTIKLPFDEFTILVISHEKKDGATDTTQVDKEDDEKKSTPKKNKHWAGIDLGVNGLMTPDNKLDLPAEQYYLDLDYARSINWSINFLEQDIRLYKEYAKIVTGLGFEFSNYSFSSKHTTILPTDSVTFAVDSTISFKKNRLKTTYLNLPVMLAFNTSMDHKKSVHVAGGMMFGYRVGSRLKQKYSQDSEDFKPKVNSDFSLNQFRYSAIARVGYGKFNLYATYALNSLFKENKGPEVYPFTMGIQLIGF